LLRVDILEKEADKMAFSNEAFSSSPASAGRVDVSGHVVTKLDVENMSFATLCQQRINKGHES
jgi:hypothetical protein